MIFYYFCKVKLATTILAIFFLGLTLMPCDDVVGQDNCGAEVHYHTNDNHEHDAESDFCSPFCQCHCCHTNVNSYQHLDLSSELSFLSTTHFGYTENNGKDISDSLLHPPQF